MKKRVCLLVTLLAIVIMGFAMSVEAAEAPGIIDRGYCGGEGDGTNLTWTLDSDGVLVIEGQGKMKDWRWEESAPFDPNNHLTDWHKYYEGIYSVIVRDGVTSIGNYGFFCCKNLSNIDLPESLTSMGISTFAWCESLSSIDLPEALTSIGEKAFLECAELRSIVLPKSLTSIGSTAFYGCSSLYSIELPESLTNIGNEAFLGCSSLTSITLPNSLTSIEEGLFWGCTKLNNIVLPSSLMHIGQMAFFECESLRNIYIPLSVKEINYEAFLTSRKGLNDIYYAGTKEQWGAIIVGNPTFGGYRNGLIRATVHYNCLPLYYAASYNKDLALVAANLSLKAYNDVASDESVENYLVNNLGFGDGSKFHTGSGDGNLSYTLATRKYYGTDAGDNTDILVITAQGSPNPYEMIPEAVSKPDYDNKKAFGGHVPYGIVEEYYNAIVGDLQKFVESGKKYKVLITGHGLAGAAANLVAANLSDGRIEGVNTKRADVFCYTFGALRSLDENAIIKGNYENIHNVYNLYDTFSYLQYGVGEGFGMFGQMHLFVLDNRTPEQRNQGNDESIFRYVYWQIYHHVNHDMEKYYSYVEGVKYGQNDLITEESPKHVSIIIGPVDVDVYCDNELVGRVTKNAVAATASSIDIRVEGDTKTILYPDDSRYEIRISALDARRMTFGQIDLIGRGVTKVIKDVSLTRGKLFSGTVGGGRTADEFRLYETNKSWKTLSEALSVSWVGGKSIDLVSFYKLMSYAPRLYRNFLKREPDETGLGDWVDALYSGRGTGAKREPDETGLGDWVDALYSGRGTGAKIVSGFVLSKEYQANSLSDVEYVTAMYRIIFNREPDKKGLDDWISILDNGCTNKKVLEGFINSDEFYNLCKDLGIERGSYESDEIADKNYLVASFVARLYRLCLGRRYERKGLDNWVRALVYRTATGSSVVKDFFNSQEFLNRNLNDEQFVTVAYLTILDRDPDAAGLESWLDALRRGYTRNQVIDGFLKSTEFGGLCKKYGIVR